VKRSLKALLVGGVMTAAMVGPAAPAQAQESYCAGVWIDPSETIVGAWTCECPPLYQLPADGHFHVVVCLSPRQV
jgi:hypothetical protein